MGRVTGFIKKWTAEVVFLVISASSILFTNYIAINQATNNSQDQYRDYAKHISSSLRKDLKKLISVHSEENLDLDIIKNYKILKSFKEGNGIYLNCNTAKISYDNKTILVDLHYIKYLVKELYGNSIQVEFLNTKKDKVKDDVSYLIYEEDIYPNIRAKFILEAESREALLEKSKRIIYIIDGSILSMLLIFYLAVRSKYTKWFEVYKQSRSKLIQQEEHRKEHIRLTKLLYKPIISKITSELYINSQGSANVNTSPIFSLIDAEGASINLKELKDSLKSFFYMIKFTFSCLSDNQILKIKVSKKVFYQIIFSLINYVYTILGENKDVEVLLEEEQGCLNLRLVYFPNKFNYKVSPDKIDLLHPFLLKEVDIFKALEAMRVEVVQETNSKKHIIGINFYKNYKEKEAAICHLSDYR